MTNPHPSRRAARSLSAGACPHVGPADEARVASVIFQPLLGSPSQEALSVRSRTRLNNLSSRRGLTIGAADGVRAERLCYAVYLDNLPVLDSMFHQRPGHCEVHEQRPGWGGEPQDSLSARLRSSSFGSQIIGSPVSGGPSGATRVHMTFVGHEALPGSGSTPRSMSSHAEWSPGGPGNTAARPPRW